MEKQYETINLDDLATLCDAVKLAVQRATYDVSEVGKIGSAYERVFGFALYTAEQYKAQEAEMNNPDSPQAE